MTRTLKNVELNGAPGWLLDGHPHVPFMAQAGKAEMGELRADTLPDSSFFRAGCRLYTTWEHGPQLSLVWKEDGSYDWSEVDGYLRKIAALDPDGLLQCRFYFDAPPWWAVSNPDHMVHVRSRDGQSRPSDIVSFASEPFWNEAEKAARGLVHFCDRHPEGWRLVGVLYHGGLCEWFPSWAPGQYSDYSPVFRDGFRAWLQQRYLTPGKLCAAWKDDAVAFETAELPSPADRTRGDFHDFYDPSKGLQRQDFCTYYSEVVTRLIERLARAFKEESGGRMYTRTPAGYQPMFKGFRYHAGPHADFSSVLDCPWLDGLFMPHDYRCRGHGGHHAFELPLASVLLHGKTYIAEMDDRTHRTDPPAYGSTDDAWQTAQCLKRGVGAALCQAAGVEFKDWGRSWYEDSETMAVIRRLNELAQESVRYDRTLTAQIAVIVNPRSTCHVRDDSPIYWALNHHQMHLCYPRIGAPFDRIMVDDLAKARQYKFYIIQDAFHLTSGQRALIREQVCGRSHTVLWIYAPGIVSEDGISVEAMSELVGMRLREHTSSESYSYRPYLRLLDAAHLYTLGVAAGTPLFSAEDLSVIFRVDDPDATTLGLGGYYFDVLRPAFAVKQMGDWTSVYCSVPVLPPAVLRNIARQAGVHIYSDMDDFVAANNWLLTVSAAIAGPRTLRIPRKATIVDAMSNEVVARATDIVDVDMKFGQTAMWKLE